MQRLALLSLCLIASCELAIAAAPPKAALRFASIQKILDDDAPTSLEKLVGLLPEPLFQDYVLMRKSDSSQPTEEGSPRVVAFGGGGDLTVSWGAGKTLEAIEFNRTTRTWDFYEVRFNDGKAGRAVKNPPRCFTCHQANGRPNWSPYARWPGAYGENEGLREEEEKSFDAFVKAKGDNARYKRLAGLAKHYNVPNGLPEPNTRLTVALYQRNFERIAAELQKRPDFAALKYALAAACVPGCVAVSKKGEPTLAFLPKDSELRKRAEQLLGDKLKPQLVALRAAKERVVPGSGDRAVAQVVPLQALLAILEAAGKAESLPNWSLAASTSQFHLEQDPKKAVMKDPLANGIRGTDMLLPWGLAEVDDDLRKVVRPFLQTVGDYLSAPDKDEDRRKTRATPGRNRDLALPYFGLSRLADDKHADACTALSALSLTALRGFAPPKDGKKDAPKGGRAH